jgi:hypothetical protein
LLSYIILHPHMHILGLVSFLGTSFVIGIYGFGRCPNNPLPLFSCSPILFPLTALLSLSVMFRLLLSPNHLDWKVQWRITACFVGPSPSWSSGL